MTIPNGASLDQLNQMLWGGSPTVAGAAAQQLIAINQAPVVGGTVPDWRLTVYDKFWNQIGIVGDYIENTGRDARNTVGSATIKVKGDDPNIPIFFTCQQTLVGVTIETEGERFAFYVDTFDYEYKDGAWVGTVHLLGIYDILNYLQIWPDWFLPIQTQILSYAIVLGPIVSSIEILIMEQALRIQTGLNEFINNALSLDPDVAAWFGALRTYGNNIYEMLCCPIVVALTNPLQDSSVLCCRTIRMEPCAKVIEDITRSTGIDVRVDLWLPGEPQPANVFIELSLPTYVVSVTDRSQIVSSGGAIIDSVVKTIVDLEGSILGDIVAPLIEGSQEVQGLPQGFFISPALGINWLPPWVLLIAPENGQPGSVDTCKITAHTPKGWQQIIGGRCVSGETLAHTENGLVEAKTLDGHEVMTLSQDGVYRLAKWQSYGEQRLFKVTFANGDEIFATAPHRWVVDGRGGWVTTLDLVGERVPQVAHADCYGQATYLAVQGASVEVVNVEETDRIETVYCCEEPVTNTWVAGNGYLTGNSPQWLNDLINIFFEWIIDAISILVGFTGIPNDLLSGFLNNAFLAFQLWESYERRSAVGPYHPGIEVFHATASAPYNIETIFGFINAFWDGRGWVCVQASCRNGENYTYGKDIFRGQLVSIAYLGRTQLYTDFLDSVTWRVDEKTRDLMLQIGDGKAIEAPLEKHKRNIDGLLGAWNTLTLAPQSG